MKFPFTQNPEIEFFLNKDSKFNKKKKKKFWRAGGEGCVARVSDLKKKNEKKNKKIVSVRHR